MDFSVELAKQLDLPGKKIAAVITLLDGGNTLPFIARYRKEATGGLDEEQIRAISTSLDSLRTLEDRRGTILGSIEEQGKLTPELEGQIRAATTRTELEDLYLPYRPKRTTLASQARERGLQGLADLILAQPITSQKLEDLARPFLNENVPTIEDAYTGARHIVAETISEHLDVRKGVRKKAQRLGVLRAEKDAKADDARGVYETYYEYQSQVNLLRPYQVLALTRGEAEKVLRIHLEIQEADWREVVHANFRLDRRSPLSHQMALAIEDAAERLLLPAIERDVRRELFEAAEAHAIKVFTTNLRGLLSQPPLAGQIVMGIDPGFRTGCKAAVVDQTGKVLDTATIYPHEPQKQHEAALKTLSNLISQHKVSLISIGNGTASRETEQLVVEVIRHHPGIKYLITNEAGASVYSASPLARQELAGMDVSMRGAVSIARRVQDPLAELVKIDPRSIGVGLYQHDVDQKLLAEALCGVVESVVNLVGVDLNSASSALLTYVAGIGEKLAENIVAYRDEHGPFSSREDLMQVPRLGPKAYEQAAGFLRIRNGKHPFDASAIHPESYTVAEAVLNSAGLKAEDPVAQRKPALENLVKRTPIESLAKKLGAGIPTLQDILEQLVRPGRDPRQDLPAPLLRSDVLKMEDLKPGMSLMGTVRNVVDFGTFIDIGVKQDGLLHRSQTQPGTILQVGQVIEVRVINIDPDRGRIGLSTLPRESAGKPR